MSLSYCSDLKKLNNIFYRLKTLLSFLLSSKSWTILKKIPETVKLSTIFSSSSKDPKFHEIENLRKKLIENETSIYSVDPGAGSLATASLNRIIRNIAKSSLSSPGQCAFLYQLAKSRNSKRIIEFGTSFGISTAYLASGASKGTVFTFEGVSEIAKKAEENFKHLGLENIELIAGQIDHTLPGFLNNHDEFDLVFMDGNHRLIPTLKYFESLLPKMSSGAVFIIDDIYWSKEMKEAWSKIKKHPNTKGTIDFYQFGLVFLESERAFDIKIRPPLKWLFL